MKAISIRQPWAWAIIHGGKPVENRTWPSHFAGYLLIHASKTFDHYGYQWLINHRKLLSGDPPHPDNYKLGGIIGRVIMVDCVDHHQSPFFFGPWGHVYKHPQEIPFIKCRGKLKLFEVDYSGAYTGEKCDCGGKWRTDGEHKNEFCDTCFNNRN